MLPPDQVVQLLKFEGLLDELKIKNDFEDRVKLTLQAIEKSLPIDVKCEQKDSEESVNLRKKADKMVYKEKGRSKMWFDTLEIYSKSIAKAKTSSLELSQAYANRSAVLFNINKIPECVDDIDRALKLNYPAHLTPNLLRRKAKCLKMLGDIEAEKVVEEARICLESLVLSDEKKEKLETKINIASKVKEIKRLEIEAEKEVILPVLPEITPHKTIPSASDAIDIHYNDIYGKHLIANRDINPGEILIIEKPYVSLLNPAHAYTHCSHCFVKAWGAIPCEHCVNVMYCSEKCKNEAWEQYHDIECPIVGYYKGLNMNDLTQISLRLTVLAVRESGGIKKLRKELKKIDSCKDLIKISYSEDGCYYSNKYKPYYNLATNEKYRSKYELLCLSLNAAFTLYYLLTLTSFLGKDLDKSVSSLRENRDAMFIGKLIAYHCMIVQMNDYEFNESRDDDMVRMGSILCSVSGLINHSCNPNLSRFSHLKDNTIQHVVYALYPIKKGSQIFDDYGYNYAYESKLERQEFAKKYFFKCNCIACEENWPLFQDLPSILTIVTDQTQKVEVARAIVRSKKHERAIVHKGLSNFTGNFTQILPSLADSITIVSESTDKPSKEYCQLLELFKQAHLELLANKLELYVNVKS